MKKTPESKANRHHTLSRVFEIILFVSLAAASVYSAIRLAGAPESLPAGTEGKTRSDYLLMLTQCILGLVVMLLPSRAARRWKLPVPDVLYVQYYMFLYCAIFLGEVFDFYYLVPFWDTLLHSFSAVMLSLLGITIVDVLNRSGKISVSLSPGFTAMFAFCFAVALGALWEIYEYSFDALLGLNMQKFRTAQGVELVGREALQDTMEDLIWDAASAFCASIVWFLLGRRSRKAGRGALSCRSSRSTVSRTRREKLSGTSPNRESQSFIVHSSVRKRFNCLRPRLMRERTVPLGQRSADAISRTEKPSR